MTERAETLAKLISLENGKALRDARGEVAYAAEFFRWNAEEAVRIVGEFGIAPAGANRIIVDYQPIGVCVLITPWNFPAAMATRKIAPALAAGCTVMLKPATETPLTAYALAALYKEAGVPDGVVNVMTTSTPGPVIAAMLADPRVRKLSFTGSTARRPDTARRSREDRPQLLDGTWRQRAAHRLRRCRSRHGDRGRDGGQDAQCRRGLYGRQPHLRAVGHLRQIRRRADQAHGSAYRRPGN